MGWMGYGLYDGDGTITCNYDFLKNAGIKKERVEEIMDDVDGNEKFGAVVLRADDIDAVLGKFDKIIKGAARTGFVKVVNAGIQDTHSSFDYEAVEWQMLGDLLMANKLPIHKGVADTVKAANAYLKGEHADDFSSPRRRRTAIDKFDQAFSRYAEEYGVRNGASLANAYKKGPKVRRPKVK